MLFYRPQRLASFPVFIVGMSKGVGPLERVFQGPHPIYVCCGGVLLSHTLPGAVPSELAGLASRFGMETGRFPAAMTTTRWFNQYSLNIPESVFGGLCWL